MHKQPAEVRHLPAPGQYLGKMQRLCAAVLRDLLATTEAVTDDEGSSLRRSHCGQQNAFAQYL
jgi:hypothetical protein